MTRDGLRQRWFVGVCGAVLALAWAAPARAQQGFISPLIGYNFGGDAACPTIDNCQDKRLNVGASVGVMGNLLGFEEEFAYAKDFFGTAPNLSSSVLTVMSNAMIVPKLGPVRPYLLAGLGLIKTHVEFTPASVLTADNNNLGWNVGGGLMVAVVPHVAVRGDIRYFHSFQDADVLGLTIKNAKLDFGRAAAGLVFTW